MSKSIELIKIVILIWAIIFLNVGIVKLFSSYGVFQIKNIVVEGNSVLTKEKIIKDSGIKINDNILKLNYNDVINMLKMNQFIDNIIIEKKYPDTVIIKVSERYPLVKIINNNNEYYAGKDGFIFEFINTGELIPLTTDVDLNIANYYIRNGFIIELINSIDKYNVINIVHSIYLKKDEGLFISLKKNPEIYFYCGKKIPDNDMYNKMLKIADKIKEEKIKIKYVDMNNENAIGFDE